MIVFKLIIWEKKFIWWLVIDKIIMDYFKIIFILFFLGKEYNFKKYDFNWIDYLNEVYDLESIMYYGKISFVIEYGKFIIWVIGDLNK